MTSEGQPLCDERFRVSGDAPMNRDRLEPGQPGTIRERTPFMGGGTAEDRSVPQSVLRGWGPSSGRVPASAFIVSRGFPAAKDSTIAVLHKVSGCVTSMTRRRQTGCQRDS